MKTSRPSRYILRHVFFFSLLFFKVHLSNMFLQYIVTLEQGMEAGGAGEEVVVQDHDQVAESCVVQEVVKVEDDVDPEEMLKAYYTTHSNTLGDSWFIW